MVKNMLKISLFLALFVQVSLSSATTVFYQGMDDLVSGSDDVVTGVIKRIKSKLEGDGLIYTTMELKPAYVIGEYGLEEQSKPIKVRFLGGEVEGMAAEVHGMPKFSEGDEVVLFLTANGVSPIPFRGFYQGVFSVDGEKNILNSHREAVVGIKGNRLILHSEKSQEEFHVYYDETSELIETDVGSDRLIKPPKKSHKKPVNIGGMSSNDFVSLVQERVRSERVKGKKNDGKEKGHQLFDLPPVKLIKQELKGE